MVIGQVQKWLVIYWLYQNITGPIMSNMILLNFWHSAKFQLAEFIIFIL